MYKAVTGKAVPADKIPVVFPLKITATDSDGGSVLFYTHAFLLAPATAVKSVGQSRNNL